MQAGEDPSKIEPYQHRPHRWRCEALRSQPSIFGRIQSEEATLYLRRRWSLSHRFPAMLPLSTDSSASITSFDLQPSRLTESSASSRGGMAADRRSAMREKERLCTRPTSNTLTVLAQRPCILLKEDTWHCMIQLHAQNSSIRHSWESSSKTHGGLDGIKPGIEHRLLLVTHVADAALQI